MEFDGYKRYASENSEMGKVLNFEFLLYNCEPLRHNHQSPNRSWFGIFQTNSWLNTIRFTEIICLILS